MKTNAVYQLSEFIREGAQTGTTLNHLQEIVGLFKQRWPSDRTERAEFSAVLNTLDVELAGLRNRVGALRRQRRRLMRMLLTGKLRVQG